MTHQYLYPAAKRIIDVSCASAGLIILSPLLLLIASYIRRKSPGPIFYRGIRVGLHGKLFSILKFRSMVDGAEGLGGSATADDDPRITPVGRILRKYKLDELPQLVNVLRGQMSLVGPRPEVKKYTEMYNESERRLLELCPGLTDWATIWDSNEGAVLAGSPDPEKLYEEAIRPTKLQLQLVYYETRSFSTDIKILFHTAMKLCSRNWTPKEIVGYESPFEARLRCIVAGPLSRS